MTNRRLIISLGLCLFASGLRINVLAQAEISPMATAMANLAWRSIGPANMGGRIADVEGVPGNPNIVYVATGSGGIFKTTNGGGGQDKFRIKIWDRASANIIYDNQLGSSDSDNPTTTIGGGSIIIHR